MAEWAGRGERARKGRKGFAVGGRHTQCWEAGMPCVWRGNVPLALGSRSAWSCRSERKKKNYFITSGVTLYNIHLLSILLGTLARTSVFSQNRLHKTILSDTGPCWSDFIKTGLPAAHSCYKTTISKRPRKYT